MKIGIFGGSFNPTHMGHFKIAQSILSSNKVDKLLVVPNYTNPLKSNLPLLPNELRWNILKSTFSELRNIEICDYELQKRAPSYTIHTIQYFKTIYPSDNLFLIVGEDTFQLFPKWHQPDKIFELVKLLVVPRPGQQMIHSEKVSDNDKVEWLTFNIPDISASKIRKSSIETIKKNKLMHPTTFFDWATYISEKC
jgi:nicotinate-nucleotide adenylyltransferase